jgi:hypothetical protein
VVHNCNWTSPTFFKNRFALKVCSQLFNIFKKRVLNKSTKTPCLTVAWLRKSHFWKSSWLDLKCILQTRPTPDISDFKAIVIFTYNHDLIYNLYDHTENVFFSNIPLWKWILNIKAIQSLHDLQSMKIWSSSPNLFKLARADIRK